MPGLVPGIHVLNKYKPEDVDGRDKPGHDRSDDHRSGLGAAMLGPVTFIIQQ